MPRRAPIEDLRAAVDCLPLRTKQAMLHGLRTNDIIVGAYTDRDGGVCPMLAAHRNGGRTSFIAFARAWDRFAGARRARRATRRELRVLEAQLRASILAEQDVTPGGPLAAAVADHQALVRERKAREAARTGFAWRAEAPTRRGPSGVRESDRHRSKGSEWLRIRSGSKAISRRS